MDIKAKKISYNAKSYFESWHQSTEEFSDRVTISPTFSLLGTKYHYNAVENSIIEFFYDQELPENIRVLDIGSGAGHWIDFYLNTFKASSCVGVEISDPAGDQLRKKYADNDQVDIRVQDISDSEIEFTEGFQIISAIGVMFHIVEDAKWLAALKNLGKCLDDNGVMVIGGLFGQTTADVQFHKVDKFSTWQERKEAWDQFSNTESEEVFVNKRVRSVAHWIAGATQCGLEVVDLIRTPNRKNIKTPQNHLLVLKKKG